MRTPEVGAAIRLPDHEIATPLVAGRITLVAVGRLLGGFNVAVGALTGLVAATSFRRGETWAWWALLIVNTIGFGAPIAFDPATGAIGLFEQLEIVAIVAIYAMLAISARASLRRRPAGERPDRVLLPWDHRVISTRLSPSFAPADT